MTDSPKRAHRRRIQNSMAQPAATHSARGRGAWPLARRATSQAWEGEWASGRATPAWRVPCSSKMRYPTRQATTAKEQAPHRQSRRPRHTGQRYTAGRGAARGSRITVCICFRGAREKPSRRHQDAEHLDVPRAPPHRERRQPGKRRPGTWTKQSLASAVPLPPKNLHPPRGSCHREKRSPDAWMRRQVDSAAPLPRKLTSSFSSGSPCLLYTSPSPRDGLLSRMPSSA